MSEFTSGNAPGFQAKIESDEAQMWWSGRHGQNHIATQKVSLDSTCTDAGNSPTSTLRGGNLLALDDSTGNAFLYDPDANNGRPFQHSGIRSLEFT